ncbi:MAG: hypothetical protein U0703_22550 [Anaerolineae bacterium]
MVYADIFDFPLTRPELHHFLIANSPVSRAQIDHALATSALLQSVLEMPDDYVIPAGRRSILVVREQREQVPRKRRGATRSIMASGWRGCRSCAWWRSPARWRCATPPTTTTTLITCW